jgi:hypothetical protein
MVRVWSKGLGRVELAINLDKVDVDFNDGYYIIKGVTEPPVVWNYYILISESEVMTMLKLASKKEAFRLFLRWLKYRLFNRKKLKERFIEATTTRTAIKPLTS